MYHVYISGSPFVREIVATAETFDAAKVAAMDYCAKRGFSLLLQDDADFTNCADGLIVKSAFTADVVCIEPVNVADRIKNDPVTRFVKAHNSPWKA